MSNLLESYFREFSKRTGFYSSIFIFSFVLITTSWFLVPKKYETSFVGTFTEREQGQTLSPLSFLGSQSSTSNLADIEILKSDSFLKSFITNKGKLLDDFINKNIDLQNEEEFYFLMFKLKESIVIEKQNNENLLKIYFRHQKKDKGHLVLKELVKHYNFYRSSQIVSMLDLKRERLLNDIDSNNDLKLKEGLSEILFSTLQEKYILLSYEEPIITTIQDPNKYLTRSIPSFSIFAFIAVILSFLTNFLYFFVFKRKE